MSDFEGTDEKLGVSVKSEDFSDAGSRSEESSLTDEEAPPQPCRPLETSNHCVQPPPDISSISLEDWRKEAPIKCTVVGVPIEKRPRAVRRHLVQQLRVLERQTGRSYRGYVMRVSSTLVKAHIVTENTESEDDMGYLWGFLKENWGSVINPRDITYANNDSGNLCYLCDDRMEAVRTDAEDGDWSRVLEPDDLPICGDDAFSVVSRLPWTEGEDGAVQQTAEW